MSVDSIFNVLKTLWWKSTVFIVNEFHDFFSVQHLGRVIIFVSKAQNRWLIFFTSCNNGAAFMIIFSRNFLVWHLSIVLHSFDWLLYRCWLNDRSRFITWCSYISDILINRLLLNRMKRMSLDNLWPLIINLWTNDLQQNLWSSYLSISLVGSHSFRNYIFINFYFC